MKKNHLSIRLLAPLALCLVLAGSAAAQPAQAEPANSPAQIDRATTQPVVRTYEKYPDPSGNDQDLNAESYRDKPNPDPVNNDFVRYSEENDANDGERYDPSVEFLDKGEE